MAEQEYGDPATRTRILEAARALTEEGADVTMGAVATRAGVSRQAVYLHVGDRTGLLTALVDHMDRSQGVGDEVKAVFAAPTGVDALERLVAMITRHHPRIIGVARVLDAARLTDPDAAAAWQDRMANRRRGARLIIQRIADEGRLAPPWDVDAAATLLYALTLPQLWDELVSTQNWNADQYRDYLTALLQAAFVRPAGEARPPA